MMGTSIVIIENQFRERRATVVVPFSGVQEFGGGGNLPLPLDGLLGFSGSCVPERGKVEGESVRYIILLLAHAPSKSLLAQNGEWLVGGFWGTALISGGLESHRKVSAAHNHCWRDRRMIVVRLTRDS